jgi:hypothetical protein
MKKEVSARWGWDFETKSFPGASAAWLLTVAALRLGTALLAERAAEGDGQRREDH